MRDASETVNTLYGDVPKFLPTPNLDGWQGENIYRFYHRPGPLWPNPKAGPLWPRSMLDEDGITYSNVAHVMLQLAFYMGFSTMLCVGLDNTGDGWHFYGEHRSGADPAVWDSGYGELYEGFKPHGRRVWNLSTRSTVTTLPQSDWREYA